VHVYALSPSPIIDASLLCTPNEAIRKSDASKDAEYAQKVGKILVSPVTVRFHHHPFLKPSGLIRCDIDTQDRGTESCREGQGQEFTTLSSSSHCRSFSRTSASSRDKARCQQRKVDKTIRTGSQRGEEGKGACCPEADGQNQLSA
jgi:hypothetical protein